MDRQSQAPVIIASSQGGMDIETVAKESPDAIITTNINIHEGVTDDIARNIASDLGFSEQCIEDAKSTIQKLYKVFMEKDATQIEINPLSETSDHQVLAMDAKLTFDDNADFRQKEVFSWRDKTQEDADEVKAAESGLNFIKLDGDIGCLGTSPSSPLEYALKTFSQWCWPCNGHNGHHQAEWRLPSQFSRRRRRRYTSSH